VLWNPDVIVTIDRDFAASVRGDSVWAAVAAVKVGRVHLSSSQCGEFFTMSEQKLVALIRSHILEAWLRPAPFAPVPLNQIGKIFLQVGRFLNILWAYRLRL